MKNEFPEMVSPKKYFESGNITLGIPTLEPTAKRKYRPSEMRITSY